MITENVGSQATRATAPLLLLVPREAVGIRLDRFLVVALSTLEEAPSRAELQRWIEGGRVTVDGTIRKAADKLREGAQVVVEPDVAALTTAKPEAGIEFDVLYKDKSLIVVNKPAGLVVHPARGHEGGTLVNGLLALGAFDVVGKAEDLSDARDAQGYLRPGIVHRLDKGTSGVMVVARTANAREKLKAQFQDHTIDREYVAICAGAVKPQTFDTLHGRHPTERLRFTSKVKTGKRAITKVTVIESFAGRATYVACRLETGRTHQIRVHLAESGHAIIGDPVYGKPPKDPFLRRVAGELGHQALHARVLGFVHPTTRERLLFEAPPPADFLSALAALNP